MSHSALLMFAPAYTTERHLDPTWNRAGRSMYSRLRFLPSRETVPVLVDHDDDREVGRVLDLFKMDWVDGPWWMARTEITDPPGWLRKKDTKVSFGFAPLSSSTFTEADTFYEAIVNEVSILSPGTKPHEPLAHVALLERQAAPAAAPEGGQVIYGGGIIRRPCGVITGVR